MVSIKDIARKAGVSQGTVDRVLHKRGRVAKETQKKIEKIVARLDYRPNIYARNLSLAMSYHFAVLIPKLNQDTGYWNILAQGIRKAQQELESFKVNVDFYCFDRYSEPSIRSTFRKALQNHPEGILIAPVISHFASDLLQSIPKQIPYVFVDSTIPESNSLSCVIQDPFQGGLLAAHLIRRMVNSGGTVVAVKVNPEDFHINERIRGFQSGMENCKGINVVLTEADSSLGERAFQRLAATIVSTYNDLKGIFVSNSYTFPFAEYLEKENRAGSVVVIGYDLISRNVRLLRRGAIEFLISQRPHMQGYEGIYSLYSNIVLREKVEKCLMMPLDILTKDNLKYYQD
ncbi:MAG: substrate-binding domain-containing protein [bacterium]